MYLQRAIIFGIYEKPTVRFLEGEDLGIIPQTGKDLEFGVDDMKKGCEEDI